jgi:hypothetical protein
VVELTEPAPGGPFPRKCCRNFSSNWVFELPSTTTIVSGASHEVRPLRLPVQRSTTPVHLLRVAEFSYSQRICRDGYRERNYRGRVGRPDATDRQTGRQHLWIVARVVWHAGLAMLASLTGWRRERRPGLLYGLEFLCLLSVGFAMSGCGGGGGSGGGGGGGTQAGTYNLTVTGTFTSGSTDLTHKTNLTLVVQ